MFFFCVGTAELYLSVSSQPLIYTVEKKKGNYNAHLNHIEIAHIINILCDIWGLSHIADFMFSLTLNHVGCETFM